MKKKLFLYSVLIPLGIVIIDQWTKFSVTQFFNVPINICEMNLAPGKYHALSGPMDISLVCNPGISWGLLQGDGDFKRWFLTIFAFLMSGILIYMLNKTEDFLSKISFSLIISGAIGNGIDRFLFGAVTDFIDFSEIGFRWVFNVADTSITCGVIGLILASFTNKKNISDV